MGPPMNGNAGGRAIDPRRHSQSVIPFPPIEVVCMAVSLQSGRGQAIEYLGVTHNIMRINTGYLRSKVP